MVTRLVAIALFACARAVASADGGRNAEPGEAMPANARPKAGPKGRITKRDPTVALTPEQMTWNEIPNGKGVKIADLWGSMDRGAYGILANFPAATAHPLHTHHGDMKVIVVSGHWLFGPEEGPERRFGPGSYVFIPGGMKHTSGCDQLAPCVIYQEQATKFDYKAVAASPTPKP